MNWDDLRFFLAVAGAGSLSGAGQQLGAALAQRARPERLKARLVLDEARPVLPVQITAPSRANSSRAVRASSVRSGTTAHVAILAADSDVAPCSPLTSKWSWRELVGISAPGYAFMLLDLSSEYVRTDAAGVATASARVNGRFVG